MKVGIVTVHDAANIGSYLQAIGLQELVLENGDTPVILRTRSKFTTLCLFLGYDNSHSVRSIKRFLFFLKKSVLSFQLLIKKFKKFLIYKKDQKLFQNIQSVRAIREGDLDVLLLGSDEIWNVNQPAFQNPYLYGLNIPANRKYAYAVSVGNVEENKLADFPNLVAGMKSLDGILVRDSYTKRVLQNNQVTINEKICDPTLQVDIRKYMKNAEDVCVPSGNYLAVYSYYADDRTVDVIMKFAHKYRLKLVAVSLYQSWCDEYVNCSPLEFGAILQSAKYVYTTTFHGTIFSALYHTNFAVRPFSQKVVDVIQQLDLEDYTLADSFTVDNLEKILFAERDYGETERIIARFRNDSSRVYKQYVQNSMCMEKGKNGFV